MTEDRLLKPEIGVAVKVLIQQIEGSVNKLSSDLQNLSTKLSGLNDQLQRTQSQMVTSSDALVKWTKRQVIAIVAYTILTGGLLIVALLGFVCSHSLVK